MMHILSLIHFTDSEAGQFDHGWSKAPAPPGLMELFPHYNNDFLLFNFCLSRSVSPVLFQSRTCPGSLWISQLCCRISPSASMPPAAAVLASSRYWPLNTRRQENRIRTRNSLPTWGSMMFGRQREGCYLGKTNRSLTLSSGWISHKRLNMDIQCLLQWLRASLMICQMSRKLSHYVGYKESDSS